MTTNTLPPQLTPTPVPGVGMLLQDNPGPMSLEGTQTYFLPGTTGWIVVDPGDDDPEHQGAIAAVGPIETILVTHRHHDHVGGLARLRAATGATSRGLADEFSVGAQPLAHGTRLALSEPLTQARVLATPGHTSDSVSIVLSGPDGDTGVLTGDTILGHGTTIIDHPDGRLSDYLDSLNVLRSLGNLATLPAHGGFPGPVDDIAREYLDHRLARLNQVRSVVDDLLDRGEAVTVETVANVVYAHVDATLRSAAEHTVAAQLEMLKNEDA